MSDLIKIPGYRPYLPAEPIGGSVKSYAGSKVDEYIANAKKFLGQAYLWGGGHSSKNGVQRVDCSGLVLQAARMSGMNLDGTAAMQQRMGKPVGLKELKPGDLLFKGNPATHVGIYLGNGQFIHSPRTGDVVKIQAMSSYSGWDNARRIFDGGAAPAPAPAAIPADSVSVSAPAPVPAAAPAAPPAAGSYTTAAGDTLWKIAERTLGDANRWREIYDLNQASLSNLNLLFPGTVLTLPAGANIPAPAAAAPMAVAAAMPAGELRQLLVAMRDQVRGALSQIDQLTPRLRDVIAGMRPNA